jgi:hypothetical protein
MKVICRASALTTEQWAEIGLPDYTFLFHVEVGKTYTVLGISSDRECISGTLLDIPAEHYVLPVPLCLFDIIDERPSRYWRAKADGRYGLHLWPEEFYIDTFHDRLSEFEPELIPIYRELRARMESEFD